jgi:ribosomal protein S18 acetylase RimI-like enzyme
MIIRELREGEESTIDSLGVSAYEEFVSHVDDTTLFYAGVSNMSRLVSSAKVFVAEVGSSIVGAVALVPPFGQRASYFDADSAVIRMLSVDTVYRGQGIGKALTQQCIDYCASQGWACIQLHTSPIMTVALPMYLRMGFELKKDIGLQNGVPYAVYQMLLAREN